MASAQTPVHLDQTETRAGKWSFTALVAFRFCFAYFLLYCLTNQVITGLVPIPTLEIPEPSRLWPVRQAVIWTASHIFHVTSPLIYQGSGSGDKTFDWVLDFCLLVLASVVTAVWSMLGRKHRNHVTLYKWFRFFIRFALAGQMISYGFDKAVPLQMSFPSLTRLVDTFGNFSPMGVLWSSIGASPSYEIFIGCAEIFGGLLLILPRTTLFGALVCLADAMEIFALNMTYDVPVKLLSFHLILFSLFLLSPDFPRLIDFFFLNRAVEPSQQESISRTTRTKRLIFAAQVFIGLWLIGMNAYGVSQDWYRYGGGVPKPALYGIWDVEQMSIDGEVRSPLLTDYERWRRVVFDVSGKLAFQRMNGSFVRYSFSTDGNRKSVAVTKGSEKNGKPTSSSSAHHLTNSR
jgi:uncharacterized membrane protein YphA (DoxX/SURF4 family)